MPEATGHSQDSSLCSVVSPGNNTAATHLTTCTSLEGGIVKVLVAKIQTVVILFTGWCHRDNDSAEVGTEHQNYLHCRQQQCCNAGVPVGVLGGRLKDGGPWASL